MCTPESFSTELQLVIKQLKGRSHRLFHDTDEVAKYLEESGKNPEVVALIEKMTKTIKEAELLAAEAIQVIADQRAQAASQQGPTVTVVSTGR